MSSLSKKSEGENRFLNMKNFRRMPLNLKSVTPTLYSLTSNQRNTPNSHWNHQCPVGTDLLHFGFRFLINALCSLYSNSLLLSSLDISLELVTNVHSLVSPQTYFHKILQWFISTLKFENQKIVGSQNVGLIADVASSWAT